MNIFIIVLYSFENTIGYPINLKMNRLLNIHIVNISVKIF